MSVELMCKDCKHFVDMFPSQSWCNRTGLSCGKMCEWFEGKDGKAPRFCRLASSVDAMAEAMANIAVAYTETTRAMDGKPVEFTHNEVKRIQEEMKAWLMEVEE